MNPYEVSTYVRAFSVPLCFCLAIGLVLWAPRRDQPAPALASINRDSMLRAIAVQNAGRWLNETYGRRQFYADCLHDVINQTVTCQVNVAGIDLFDEDSSAQEGMTRFSHSFYLTCQTVQGGSCELTH